ncbi:MAG: DUF1788 domain-containing protein [Chloroflexi bacterium]|nr:DUF1788 domain-containing protein [Chloroflexota bacterium]
MSKIDRLVESYRTHLRVPWRDDASPEERVIFCVYSETQELHLRAKIPEFDLATHSVSHGWFEFDFTDTFAVWLSQLRYSEHYFERPDLISSALDGYSRFLLGRFSSFLQNPDIGADSVVALTGVAALFGLVKVRDVVATFAPLVRGRLVVFFPGNYENNNYKLLNAYDGWNYLAVAITADADL